MRQWPPPPVQAAYPFLGVLPHADEVLGLAEHAAELEAEVGELRDVHAEGRRAVHEGVQPHAQGRGHLLLLADVHTGGSSQGFTKEAGWARHMGVGQRLVGVPESPCGPCRSRRPRAARRASSRSWRGSASPSSAVPAPALPQHQKGGGSAGRAKPSTCKKRKKRVCHLQEKWVSLPNALRTRESSSAMVASWAS